MTGSTQEFFGGGWTEQKLAMLAKYLSAYTTALKKQRFERLYVDAFAGTGYRRQKEVEEGASIIKELAGEDAQGFLDGSARIALRADPAFDRYIFVELAQSRFEALRTLKAEFPGLADRIQLEQADCNAFMQAFCTRADWSSRRAVVFLDPYGMQVEWSTMEALASTKAIDVWVLFPLGMAVNRLLTRDGKIPGAWRDRLDRIFGTRDWYDVFYRQVESEDLFGERRREVRKTVSLEGIGRYYNQRLKTIFAAVAENPRNLPNSTGNPLYLLCFAVGNPAPRAMTLALKIAEHILKG
jgi:three-Cys-motif partner protein